LGNIAMSDFRGMRSKTYLPKQIYAPIGELMIALCPIFRRLADMIYCCDKPIPDDTLPPVLKDHNCDPSDLSIPYRLSSFDPA